MRLLRVILPILVLATGCKQQLGDRCQVNSDCAEGECSADDICRISGGGTVYDAGPADAAIDAALDNPADARVVDAPAPDAATPDAATPDAT